MDEEDDDTPLVLDAQGLAWIDDHNQRSLPLLTSTRKLLVFLRHPLPDGHRIDLDPDVTHRSETSATSLPDDDDNTVLQEAGFWSPDPHFEFLTRKKSTVDVIQQALDHIAQFHRESKSANGNKYNNANKKRKDRQLNAKLLAMEEQRDKLQQQQNGTNTEDNEDSIQQQPQDDPKIDIARIFNSLLLLTPLLLRLLLHPRRNDKGLVIQDVKLASGKHPKCFLIGDAIFDICKVKTCKTMYSKLVQIYARLGVAVDNSNNTTDASMDHQTLQYTQAVQKILKDLVYDFTENLTDAHRLLKQERVKVSDKLQALDQQLGLAVAAADNKNSTNQQQQQEQHKRYRKAIQTLHANIDKQLQKVFPGSQLSIYGSCLSDLTLGHSSDVDLSLHIDHMQEQKDAFHRGELSAAKFERFMKNTVYQVCRKLEARTNDYRSMQPITRARVPVVRGTFSKAHNPYTPDGALDFDICFLNDIAVANSSLLKEYAQVDVRAKQLMVEVKRWAKQHEICSAKDQTYSSYTWMILVVFFLQTNSFVPNLQSPQLLELIQPQQQNDDTTGDDRWNHINNLDTRYAKWEQVQSVWQQPSQLASVSVTEMLYKFFHFYACEFPRQVYLISIKRNNVQAILPKTVFDHKNCSQFGFCIEDPFETYDSHCPHNLGAHANDPGFLKILQALQDAEFHLRQILVGTLDVFQPQVPASTWRDLESEAAEAAGNELLQNTAAKNKKKKDGAANEHSSHSKKENADAKNQDGKTATHQTPKKASNDAQSEETKSEPKRHATPKRNKSVSKPDGETETHGEEKVEATSDSIIKSPKSAEAKRHATPKRTKSRTKPRPDAENEKDGEEKVEDTPDGAKGPKSAEVKRHATPKRTKSRTKPRPDAENETHGEEKVEDMPDGAKGPKLTEAKRHATPKRTKSRTKPRPDAENETHGEEKVEDTPEGFKNPTSETKRRATPKRTKSGTKPRPDAENEPLGEEKVEDSPKGLKNPTSETKRRATPKRTKSGTKPRPDATDPGIETINTVDAPGCDDSAETKTPIDETKKSSGPKRQKSKTKSKHGRTNADGENKTDGDTGDKDENAQAETKRHAAPKRTKSRSKPRPDATTSENENKTTPEDERIKAENAESEAPKPKLVRKRQKSSGHNNAGSKEPVGGSSELSKGHDEDTDEKKQQPKPRIHRRGSTRGRRTVNQNGDSKEARQTELPAQKSSATATDSEDDNSINSSGVGEDNVASCGDEKGTKEMDNSNNKGTGYKHRTRRFRRGSTRGIQSTDLGNSNHTPETTEDKEVGSEDEFGTDSSHGIKMFRRSSTRRRMSLTDVDSSEDELTGNSSHSLSRGSSSRGRSSLTDKKAPQRSKSADSALFALISESEGDMLRDLVSDSEEEEEETERLGIITQGINRFDTQVLTYFDPAEMATIVLDYPTKGNPGNVQVNETRTEETNEKNEEIEEKPVRGIRSSMRSSRRVIGGRGVSRRRSSQTRISSKIQSKIAERLAVETNMAKEGPILKGRPAWAPAVANTDYF